MNNDYEDILEDSLEMDQPETTIEEQKSFPNQLSIKKPNQISVKEKEYNKQYKSNQKLQPINIFDWDESVETIQTALPNKPSLNKLPPKIPTKEQLPNDSALNQRELLEIKSMQKHLLSKRLEKTKITSALPLSKFQEIGSKAYSSKSQSNSTNTFFKEFTQNVAELQSEETSSPQTTKQANIPLPQKLPQLKEQKVKNIQNQLVNQWRPISAQEMATRPISSAISVRRKVSKSKMTIKPPSNKQRIKNAIQKVCLAGFVNSKERSIVLESIALNETDNFIIVLKNSEKLEYRGIYSYKNGIVTKISSQINLPQEINPQLVAKYFRYDTGSNSFKEIISNTMFSYAVDAVSLVSTALKKNI